MAVLSRKERRLIEHHLRRYEVCRNKIADYYAKVEGSGSPDRTGGGNLPGDPTARIAVSSIEPPQEIREAQRWIQVHQMTRDRLNVEKKDFMDRVFYRDQPMVGVLAGMHIEQATFFRWKENIITTFAMCAAVKGMFSAEEKTMIVFRPNSVV